MTNISDYLAGRIGYCLCAAMLIGYLMVSLQPFDWSPPRRFTNGAHVDRDGSIRFVCPGMMRSPEPPVWLKEQLADLTFRLRIRPGSTLQTGPARILTVSRDHYERNLTIAQEKSHLVVRLRTRSTSRNGEPHYTICDVFAKPEWRLIELNIQGDKMEILVDGDVLVTDCLPRDPLATWNHEYRLALGNEFTWSRPWLGEISEATVTINGQLIDYLEPGRLAHPTGYWVWRDQGMDSLMGVVSWSVDAKDIALNSVCFVPFGVILASLHGRHRPLPFAAVFCGVVCFAVELAQVGFAGRHPSPLDWTMNVTGATVGAWFARRFFLS